MFTTALDHIVVVVPDLEIACDYFAKVLSVRPVIGGKHVGLGTHNAFLGLGNPKDKIYLELLAIDPEDDEPRDNYPFSIPTELNGAYVAAWCLRSEDGKLTELNDNMAKFGTEYQLGLVKPMQRQKPDGELLVWQIAYSTEQYKASHGIVPFLIQWADLSQHPTTNLKAEKFCPFSFVICDNLGNVNENLSSLGLSPHGEIVIENAFTPNFRLCLGEQNEIVLTAMPQPLAT